MSTQLRYLFSTTTPVLLLAVWVAVAVAQKPIDPQTTAPPPLKIIPKSDRAQLDLEKDTKDRLRIIIQLATTHLQTAESYTAQSNFEAASAEVGIYHALIESALASLATLKRDANKTRDLYKRLELTLRAHGPRLTAMRRITPLEFAVWIKQVEDFARDGRTEALNSFYGHTVVRDKNENKDPNEKPEPTPKNPEL
jgi:hypothetical protein